MGGNLGSASREIPLLPPPHPNSKPFEAKGLREGEHRRSFGGDVAFQRSWQHAAPWKRICERSFRIQRKLNFPGITRNCRQFMFSKQVIGLPPSHPPPHPRVYLCNVTRARKNKTREEGGGGGGKERQQGGAVFPGRKRSPMRNYARLGEVPPSPPGP